MSIFDRFKKSKTAGIKEKETKKEESKVFQAEKALPVESKISASKSTEFKKSEKIESWRLLIRPVISEKATDLAARSQYIFEVASFATKSEIKKAIFNLYNVKPVKINIINLSGKKVRYGRSRGQTKKWRKAIVILRPQDKIEVYQGV